jgi:hypothetical protein
MHTQGEHALLQTTNTVTYTQVRSYTVIYSTHKAAAFQTTTTNTQFVDADAKNAGGRFGSREKRAPP